MSPASRSPVRSRRSSACARTGTGCGSSPTTRHARARRWSRSCARWGSSSRTTSCRRRRRPQRWSSGAARVYALVMSAIVPDLAGIELVGEGADAVLVGGCDETTEPNQVFSHMNLARAFSEIEAGADLFCLHKNPWWQTARGPVLDGGAFVAGARVRDGSRGDRDRQAERLAFAAALAALDAEPELTWMVARRSRAGHPRRAALRDEDAARADRQVPPRGARALEHRSRRRAQLDRATCPDWINRAL